MAHWRFVEACERYQKIKQTVEDEDVFKMTRVTFDSCYLAEYGADFVGYEAYKLRYGWLTRYGAE